MINTPYLIPRSDKPPAPRLPPLLTSRLLIKLIGVSGFLGLLAAGAYVRGGEYVCRGLALLWFAAFGVAYVRIAWGSRRDSDRP